MTTPLVTIGITCFNAADTIERAINSALAQTWHRFEVVAIDDCSTDGTRDIIYRLARRHPQLRAFHNQRNGGEPVTRNRILAEANGEFIAFFDDDDESVPERVTTQLNRILNYERDFAAGAPVICHAARLQRYPGGGERIEGTMGENEGRRAPAGLPVARRILLGARLKDGYGSCACCSAMARVITYRALGGFDPRLRRICDTEFNIRVAENGGHFVGISKPLVVQTMTTAPDKSLAEDYRHFLLTMEKHRKIMEREGQYNFCRSWIAVKQAWLEGRYVDFSLELASLACLHPFLTTRRLAFAMPNVRQNSAFRRLHARSEG